MNVFVIKDGSVRGIKVTAFNTTVIDRLDIWRKHDPKRIIYSFNKNVWYQLTYGRHWIPLSSKPKMIQMAELIGAIPVINLGDLKSELSPNSFFENQRSRT